MHIRSPENNHAIVQDFDTKLVDITPAIALIDEQGGMIGVAAADISISSIELSLAATAAGVGQGTVE